ALVHQMQHAVENRQQDRLFRREIVGQLAATHAGLVLNLRERQVLQPFLRDDGNGRLDNLLPTNAANINSWRLHGDFEIPAWATCKAIPTTVIRPFKLLLDRSV